MQQQQQMLDDQYGLSHFLNIIKSNDPLMLGQDLAKMGLDFSNKNKLLHKTFSGPWNTSNIGGQMSTADLEDGQLPEEYRNIEQIRKRLPDLKIATLHEEVLFYLFYNRPGDVCQLAAASELIKRNWRFHKVLKCWLLTVSPPNFTSMPNEDFGDCLCTLFDPYDWKKRTQTVRLKSHELESNLDVYGGVCSSSSSTSTELVAESVGQKMVAENRMMEIGHRNGNGNGGNGRAVIGNGNYSPGCSLSMESTKMEKNDWREREQMAVGEEDHFSATISSVIDQLRLIALGKSAIARTEMRILLNFLRENTEILSGKGFDERFLNFLQYEPEIAALLLVFQLMYDLKAYCANMELLLGMELNVQMIEMVNKFVQLCAYKSLPIPEDFLRKFISLCISSCERLDAAQNSASHRFVRMVCLFLSSLLSNAQFNSNSVRSEIQNFATAYLSLEEASHLYQKALDFQPSSLPKMN